MKIKVIAVLSAAAMIASSAVTVAGAQTVQNLRFQKIYQMG